MSKMVHLDARDVPQIWVPNGYKGRKFKAVICEDRKVTISDSQLQWSGGTRDSYCVIDANGQEPLVPAKRWPECGEQTIDLFPGRVVRCHSIFCGKDMGLTFYCVPEDVNPSRLEAPAQDLSDLDRQVLQATRNYKSSYAGRTRRDMVNDDLRMRRQFGENVTLISKDAWAEAVARLQDLGLLDARGAITNKGKNVLK
jgi:hypothetical protein